MEFSVLFLFFVTTAHAQKASRQICLHKYIYSQHISDSLFLLFYLQGIEKDAKKPVCHSIPEFVPFLKIIPVTV